MKKLIAFPFLLFVIALWNTTFLSIKAQQNTSCESAFQVCKNVSQSFDFRNRSEKDKTCEPKALFYRFQLGSNTAFNITMMQTSGTYNLYGPFTSEIFLNCESIYNYTASTVTGTLNAGINTAVNVGAGYYILQINPSLCYGEITLRMDEKSLICSQTVTCVDCVSSFSPMPGRYVVSAWVKESNAPQSTTNYTKPYLKVSFAGAANSFNLFPSGKIIDGWQKIDSIITIPTGASSINIGLKVTSGDAYFDDIRFFPIDGSMMSYVYDPVSLKLMAQLDERNYATLYEYDEEGKLIRVKKETEKGIMTIQENRDNILKH